MTKASTEILASLKQLRATTLAEIAEREKILANVDALLASMGETAPPARRPAPAVKPSAKYEVGYGAQALAILKRTPGQPVRARDIIEEIARGVEFPSDEAQRKAARRTLDTSARNALSKLYTDPTTGVKLAAKGYYVFEPVGVETNKS